MRKKDPYLFLLFCWIYSCSLSLGQITPVPYKPYVFNPNESKGLKFDAPAVGELMLRNNQLMMQANSMSNDRMKYATGLLVEVQNMFAEAAKQLSPDEETRNWLSVLYKSYIQPAKSAYDSGDYALARDKALDARSMFYQNTELDARKRSYKDYCEFVERAFSREGISNLTKQRWLAEHPYDFSKVSYRKGDNIYAKSFSEVYSGFYDYPVRDINWQAIANRLSSNIPSNVKNRKSIIRTRIKPFLQGIQGVYEQIYQDYRNIKYYYNQYRELMIKVPASSSEYDGILKTFNNLKSIILNDNGEYVDLDCFIERRILRCVK